VSDGGSPGFVCACGWRGTQAQEERLQRRVADHLLQGVRVGFDSRIDLHNCERKMSLKRALDGLG
jgi:hypothetical protein